MTTKSRLLEGLRDLGVGVRDSQEGVGRFQGRELGDFRDGLRDSQIETHDYELKPRDFRSGLRDFEPRSRDSGATLSMYRSIFPWDLWEDVLLRMVGIFLPYQTPCQ